MEKYIGIESLIEELDDSGMATDSEKSKTECECTVTEWGEALTVSYVEKNDGGEAKSLISVKPDEITVTRTGAIESTFVFREGECTKTLYKVPPYAFDAEIKTKRIRRNVSDGSGEITIFYEMSLGGAKKRVRMKIGLGDKR